MATIAERIAAAKKNYNNATATDYDTPSSNSASVAERIAAAKNDTGAATPKESQSYYDKTKDRYLQEDITAPKVTARAPSFSASADLEEALTSLQNSSNTTRNMYDGLNNRRNAIDSLMGQLDAQSANLEILARNPALYTGEEDNPAVKQYGDAYKQYQAYTNIYNTAVQQYNDMLLDYNSIVDQYQTDIDAFKTMAGNGMTYAKEYNDRADQLEEEAANLLSEAGAIMQELSYASLGDNGSGSAFTMNEMQKAAQQKKEEAAELRRKAQNVTGIFYSNLPNADDFKTRTTAVSGKQDDIYNFINNLDGAREDSQQQGGAAHMYGEYGDKTAYSYMNDDEIATYNYIYSKNGKNAADEYLSYIRDSLNARLGENIYDSLSGVEKGLYWIPQGLSQATVGMQQAFNSEALPTSEIQYAGQLANQDILYSVGLSDEDKARNDEILTELKRTDLTQKEREELEQGLKSSTWGKVLSGAYQFGTVVTNMLPSIMVSYVTGGLLSSAVGAGAISAATAARIASATGSSIMGLSAGGNAYQQKMKEGWTKEQAKTYATLVGSSEALLQYLLGGIDQLAGKAGAKVAEQVGKQTLSERIIGTVLKQVAKLDNVYAKFALEFGTRLFVRGGSEFLEESLQEILEPVFAHVIHGDEIHIDAGDVLYAGLMGFLAAGFFDIGNITSEARASRASESFRTSEHGYIGASGIDWFEGCATPEDVESRFKQLAKRYHPDINNTAEATETMAEINNQRDLWDQFFDSAQAASKYTKQAEPEQAETAPVETEQTEETDNMLTLPTAESEQIETAQAEQITPTEEVAPAEENALQLPGAEEITEGGNINVESERAEPAAVEPGESVQPAAEQSVQPELGQTENAVGETVEVPSDGRRGGSAVPGRVRNAAVSQESWKIKGGSPEHRKVVYKRQLRAAAKEAVSPASLGIRDGSSDASLHLYTEDMWEGDAEVQGIKKKADELGIGLTIVMGPIEIKCADGVANANGVVNPETGAMVLQGDVRGMSLSELFDHECFHQLIRAGGAERVNTFSDAVRTAHPNEWESVFNRYKEQYSKITNNYANMTDEEMDQYIWEEIGGDAYANKDKFGQKASLFHTEAMDAVSDLDQSAAALPVTTETTAPTGTDVETPEARGPPDTNTTVGRVEKYSLDPDTIDYAIQYTCRDENTKNQLNLLKDSLASVASVQDAIYKEVGGRATQNIHTINDYLAAHPDAWQQLWNIQQNLIDAGVRCEFVTAPGTPNEIDGAEVAGGLIGLPIEYVASTTGKRVKFSAFWRQMPQMMLDSMTHDSREHLRTEIVKGVEDAYRRRVGETDLLPYFAEQFPTSAEVKKVAGPVSAKNISNRTMAKVQAPLRSAEKTVMALNLNSACPMFTIGNNGCYLDACYLTQMANGATGTNLFRSAWYTGEVLQIADSDIDLMNKLGGLRINGVGDTTMDNKSQLKDVIRHAGMRGLKLKMITKQRASLEVLAELYRSGVDISHVTVQPSMDTLWIPAELDDIYGAGVRGTTQLADTVKAGRLDAAASGYEEMFGRATKIEDGVLYRKYGFSPEQIREMKEDFPFVQITPRYVVCTAAEIAEIALNRNGDYVNGGKVIQTLMHGKVPEGCVSDYPGELLNFGGARHVVSRVDGQWKFYGEFIGKDGKVGKIVDGPNTPYGKVMAYVEANYTPQEQNKIWSTLRNQMCCQANDFKDACAGCQSLCARGCAAFSCEDFDYRKYTQKEKEAAMNGDVKYSVDEEEDERVVAGKRWIADEKLLELDNAQAEWGININTDARDFVREILSPDESTRKTIETRNGRNVFKSLLGKRVGLIETHTGKQAQLVGYATISQIDRYDTAEEFAADVDKHRITDGPYAFQEGLKKYGYTLTNVEEIEPQPISTTGISKRPLSTAKGKGRGVTEHDALQAIYDALDHADRGHDNLIQVGTVPAVINAVSDVEGELYVYRNHLYENIVSEERAKEDGRFNERGHYHGLGEDMMQNALVSLNMPDMIIADQMYDGNPAVSLVLPDFDENDNPIHAVISLYDDSAINGERTRKPHIAVTFYGHGYENTEGRKSIIELVNDAIENGKVLYVSKEIRENQSVIAKHAPLGNITENSLKKNIALFKKKVKEFKNKYGIRYSVDDDIDAAADAAFIEDINRQFAEERAAERRAELEQNRDSFAPTFYSKLQREVANFKGNKIGASSAISYLKGHGVKDEEIKWSGINTFLEGKKSVDKQELLDWLKGNELQIEEETLGSVALTSEEKETVLTRASELFEEVFDEELPQYIYDTEEPGARLREEIEDRYYGQYGYDEELKELEDIINNLEGGETKWSAYKLNGGRNYREILFKIPGSDYSNNAMGTHWDGRTGVLAHARVQDMESNGFPVLFIEEIQSDWHNAGQHRGYRDDITDDIIKNEKIRVKKLKEEYLATSEDRDKAYFDYWKAAGNAQGKLFNEKGVELHPGDIREILFGYMDSAYKTDLENSLTDEERQNVSKYVELVNKEINMQRELDNAEIALDSLQRRVPNAPYAKNYHEFVLKNLLRQAAENGDSYLAWTPAEIQAERWKGHDPKMYEIEYDQDIPKFLNKYGKQWGAKVTEITLDGNGERVPAIEITDAMRDSVLYEGQPRYSVDDDEYLRLAEDPEANREQLQEMVDEAARVAGYTEEMFHGRYEDFNRFDYARMNYGNSGYGFYFGDRDRAAEFAGKDVIRVYINRDRIGTEDSNLITPKKFLNAVTRLGLSAKDTYKEYGDTAADYILACDGDDWKIAHQLQDWAIYPEYYGKVKSAPEKTGEEILHILQETLGLDGIESEWLNETVLWDNRLIKYADPVTYDRNGNVIPLSERFRTDRVDESWKNSDMRYAVDDEGQEYQNFVNNIENDAENLQTRENPEERELNLKRAADQFRSRQSGQESAGPIGLQLPTTETNERRNNNLRNIVPEDYENMDAFERAVEARAAAAQAERLRTISKEDFVGTPALEKLGVKIEGSVGLYHNTQELINANREAKKMQRKIQKAEQRLGVTEAEKNFAAGLAAGLYTESDIPDSMDADAVEELADYYFAGTNAAKERLYQQKHQIEQALDEKMETLFEDSDNYKPSKALTLNYRTPERNMLHIFGDKQGEVINQAIFYPVAVNEAERFRFVNRMHDEVRKFENKDGKQRKLNKNERALTQMVIEGRAAAETVAGMEMHEAIQAAAANILNGADRNDAFKEFSLGAEEQKAAVQYARWLQTQQMLDSGKYDTVKIDNAVKKYSQLFGEFYDAINDFLVAHGYEPIGFIKGYAPHMQPEGSQTLLNKVFNQLGINTDVTRLPTSIAGLTANFKPNKRWNPYFLQRTGTETEYDIASAFESYVDYMSDVLYHTDDTMRVRAAARYFRRTYAPEEIRNALSYAQELRYGTPEQKANFLRAQGKLGLGSALTPAEIGEAMDEYVQKLLDDISKTTKYSDLVMWLDNYANILAGKQSMADRSAETMFGRTFLNVGNRLTRAFAQANVAGSLSSMLNQSAQLPMIQAELGDRWAAAAIKDIVTGRTRKGEWMSQSDFLVGKAGIDYLVSTPGEMALSIMFKPAELMDTFVATVAVRGKYLKEIHNGKSHKEAMKAADRFGTSVMGSRMKGSKPVAFNSKNPLYQMVNVFQIEAFNSWEHIEEDLPRDFRTIEEEKGKGKATWTLASIILKGLLLSFLGNRLAEKLYGGTPMPFDLIGLTANFIASGQGLTTNDYLMQLVDNAFEKMGMDRIFDTERTENEEFDWGAAIEDTSFNVVNDLPFLRNVSGLLGIGDQTLPMPDLYGAGKNIWQTFTAEDSDRYDKAKSVLELLAQFLPGGRQAKKSALGAETVLRGGDFSGRGENRKLKYPTDGDTWSDIQAILFGKYATEASDEYYAAGRSPLSINQTKLWQAMVDAGADPQDIYNAILDYRALSKDEEMDSYERGVEQRDLLRNLDVSDDLKLQMYRELTNADSRSDKFEKIMDAGLSFDRVMDIYDKYAEIEQDEDAKAQAKANEFAKWLDKQKLSDKQKTTIKDQLKYYSIIPAEASRYDKFTDAGLEPEDAYKLSEVLSGLEPEEGKENATDMQKYRAIAASNLSEREKITAIGTIMGSDMYTDTGKPSQYAKMVALTSYGLSVDQYLDLHEVEAVDGYIRCLNAGDYGVTPETYVYYVTTKPNYDQPEGETGHGTYDQSEITAVVSAIPDIDNDQRAVLWQISNKTWKPNKNPWSYSVGASVYDAIHGETDELLGLELPS